MIREWEAEKTIEPALALRLVRSQFPYLKSASITPLGIGWDNTAFVVNEDLLFRFPRKGEAVPLLEKEWECLSKLSPRLPLSIPVPRWKGSATSDFPWPFIGYRMLPGMTACQAELSEDERYALAQPLAEFLAVLHALPRTAIPGRLHLTEEDHIDRVERKRLIAKIVKHFDELSTLGLLENGEQLKLFIASQNYRKPVRSTLVHGDLYVRHLMVDAKRRLTGIIDWGEMHIGDPAIDLAIAHSFLPLRAHDLFRKVYGEIAEDTWELARLRAIYCETSLVLYGHHSKDLAIIREGLRSLAQLGDLT